MTVTLDIQLQDYILEEEIGRGDLAIVYRARRRSDGAEVAVKMLACHFTFDEFFGRRFKDIAKQTARLEHPNIVRTYEAKQQGSVLYVVRELIDARPLAEVLEEEGPFPPQRMLIIARQIASALDYAHQKSINHGDLSANRIYLDTHDHATVADFGQTQAMVGTSLVKQGYSVGSPETMAPERVHGQGPSRQSDLYSLGILCYQMLTNKPPFIGTPAAILHAQAYEQPRPLHLINPSISVPLSEAIGRMLSKGLELRYNTGAEFVRALSVAIEGTAPIRAPAVAAAQIKEAGLQSTLPFWKRPWVWLLIAIPIIALLLALGFWVVSLFGALLPATISTSEPALIQATSTFASQSVVEAEEKPVNVPVVVIESTSIPAPAPEFTPTPSVTPTFIPLPTPGAPTIADDSPFTNLRLAQEIGEDNQPEKVGTSFLPGSQPVYLFFDYDGIKPGTTWSHRWTWADTELDAYQDVWSSGYNSSGTAWVYYNPTGGYQPGPYKVTLEINGQTVATATFVIQPGA
ncbi:MAG TPA: serine/threonine-protein kinase, partial [Anaerolineae bacterium]|nr:serine/threonine-protein kinase [Anaerolineae bacterium]